MSLPAKLRSIREDAKSKALGDFMNLPLDYRKKIHKQKYLDEETPMFNRWFIFGEYDDGTVCIVDGPTDIFVRVPRDAAERIIAARDKFVEIILSEMLGNFDTSW